MSINTEIDAILEEMVKADGITGLIAINNDGQILASRMPAMYEEEILEEISKEIANCILNVKDFGVAADDFIYHYSNIRLITKNLRRGFLVIMCMPTISIPLLDITTNRGRKKITSILSFSKKPKRPAPLPAAAPPEVPIVEPIAEHVPAAQSEMELRHEINRAKMDDLATELAKYLGPAAIVILQRSASQLGETLDAFDQTKVNALITDLSNKIDDVNLREDFSENAAEILTAL